MINAEFNHKPPLGNVAIPWVEKYRPTQFDNIVLDPLNRTFFENIIRKKHFPNLLFYGPPGTGKTTTIINLINEYQKTYTRQNKETVIHLNASDERGVDVIRAQIYQFVRSHHIFETGCKFVILDEVDYMTKNAQQALKTLLQTQQNNVRFCLICNYISKIDKSLQGEFICVRFNQLPPPEIRIFINKIAEAEQIQISSDEIEMLMTGYQSDVRSMINFMQSAGFPKIDESSPEDRISLLNPRTIAGEQPKQNYVKNAISVAEWNYLHEILFSGTLTEFPQVAVEYISILSALHNVHKKQILLGYMNQVFRKYAHLVTPEIIDVLKCVSHSSDDMPIDDVVRFFVIHLRALYHETKNT
jgi:DNA polymerase III delta prime subunit